MIEERRGPEIIEKLKSKLFDVAIELECPLHALCDSYQAMKRHRLF